MCMDENLPVRLRQLLTDVAELVLLVCSTETWVGPSKRSVALRDSIDRLGEVLGEAGDRVSKELPTDAEGLAVRDATIVGLPGAAGVVGGWDVRSAGPVLRPAGLGGVGARGAGGGARVRKGSKRRRD